MDRIWTLRVGEDSPLQLVLKRTEANEIAGHEFWSSDGSTIWFDHNYRQTPGKQYLEGENVTNGNTVRYPISSPFVSIHYTQSPDGRFAGDGGTVKNHPERQGMYILIPDNGMLRPIKLCSMRSSGTGRKDCHAARGQIERLAMAPAGEQIDGIPPTL